MFVQVKALK